jgi:hypothetical protein
MAPLWATEETVRGHDPAARVTARQEKSAAIVAAGCRSYRANQSRRGDPPCARPGCRARALPRASRSTPTPSCDQGKSGGNPHCVLGYSLTELTTISGLIASAGSSSAPIVTPPSDFNCLGKPRPYAHKLGCNFGSVLHPGGKCMPPSGRARRVGLLFPAITRAIRFRYTQ